MHTLIFLNFYSEKKSRDFWTGLNPSFQKKVAKPRQDDSTGLVTMRSKQHWSQHPVAVSKIHLQYTEITCRPLDLTFCPVLFLLSNNAFPILKISSLINYPYNQLPTSVLHSYKTDWFNDVLGCFDFFCFKSLAQPML